MLSDSFLRSRMISVPKIIACVLRVWIGRFGRFERFTRPFVFNSFPVFNTPI
jgi:hypothetical protein